MLIKPDIAYQNNQSTPSFSGLTSKLAKNMHTKREIQSLLNKYEEKTNGICGNLPPSWINKIPHEERRHRVKEIFQSFSEIFSHSIFYDTKKIKEQNEAVEKFESVLKDAGILKKKIALKHIEGGSYGEVYRLDINDESFAFKCMYNTCHYASDPVDGNLSEQAAALFINKNIPKKHRNWAQFFFGDLKNGTMLSRFCTPKDKIKSTPYDIRKLGLIPHIDHNVSRNKAGDMIVDFGRTKFEEIAKNKTYRYVRKKSMESENAITDILKETLQWQPSHYKDERIIGIIHSLDRVPKDSIKNCLDMIYPQLNQKTSKVLAQNVFSVPFSLRKKVFDKLINLDNEQVDIELAKNLSAFTLTRNYSFQKLVEKNNTEVNIRLIKYIKLHSPRKISKYFGLFSQNPDVRIKRALAEEIHYLPVSTQIKWAKKLIHEPDAQTFNILRQKLYFLPEKNQKQIKKLMAKPEQ